MQDEISLYNSIREMKRLTAQGKPFDFAHATYDRECNSTSGIRQVHAAVLRPAAKADKIAHADHKLFYQETITGKNRNCWQVLIIEFNGMNVCL